MKVNENEFGVVLDCDNTLIMHDFQTNVGTIKIINPYDGAIHFVKIHERHKELLRQYKAKNFHITVWSNNGARWAETVVKALGLEAYVDEVRCKPIKYVDDQADAGHVVGSHVYIPYKEPEYCFVPYGSGTFTGTSDTGGSGQVVNPLLPPFIVTSKP